SVALLVAVAVAAHGQQQNPPAPAPAQNAPKPPAADAVAATVNGHPVPEVAVFRALPGGAPLPEARRQELRTEILNFLIDNVLVDQYLDQLKVSVDAKDVDAQLEKVKAEIKNSGKDIQQLYQSLLITEAELRAQILAMARWDKFLQQYTTDKNLRDFFDGNKALFDGSQMRAKHILVQVKAGDAQAAEQAKARIALLKKQVTDKV